MKIFLDTSSLFKLYHRESDTALVEQIFYKFNITNVYLSEITKIEFASAIWKKFRTNEITEIQALTTLSLFEKDIDKYTFVVTNSIVIEKAIKLISKYGFKGLRTLDSLQLSSAISLKSEVDLFVTSDSLLKFLLNQENLPTEIVSN